MSFIPQSQKRVSAEISSDGILYPDYDSLIARVNGDMNSKGYNIVKARSHRGRQGGSNTPNNPMVRCDLVCSKGGRPYKSHATKHKTTTKKTGCRWQAKAVLRKREGGWVYLILHDQHNHDPDTEHAIGQRLPTPPTSSPEANNGRADSPKNGRMLVPPPPQHLSYVPNGTGDSNNSINQYPPEQQMAIEQFKSHYLFMTSDARQSAMTNLRMRMTALLEAEQDIQGDANSARNSIDDSASVPDISSMNSMNPYNFSDLKNEQMPNAMSSGPVSLVNQQTMSNQRAMQEQASEGSFPMAPTSVGYMSNSFNPGISNGMSQNQQMPMTMGQPSLSSVPMQMPVSSVPQAMSQVLSMGQFPPSMQAEVQMRQMQAEMAARSQDYPPTNFMN